ncbi:MAG: SRPBCC family protein [Myxococcota bacterium]
MATVVAAPRAAVWDALADPEQIGRWRPGVRETLHAPVRSPSRGRQLRFRCLLKGVPVMLEETTLEVVPGERLRSEARLGLFHFEETFSITAADPDGGHTRVGLRIAAPSEAPLVGAILDRFAVRRFATELAATYLHALRDWCELGRPPALPLPELVTAREVR